MTQAPVDTQHDIIFVISYDEKHMKYHLKITSWEQDEKALSNIRRQVFIEEQNVPEELEWDEYDPQCIQLLVRDNRQQAVATARMKPDGHIGRMAVLQAYRNNGIGTAMLSLFINTGRNNKLEKLYLHAQTSAIPFYEKQGFISCSEEFMDAGIPHKTMQLLL